MNEPLTRRTVLQAALAAGVGVSATAAAVSAEQSQSAQRAHSRRLTSIDPYEDLLRRYGGEMGGRKSRP